MSDTWHEWQDGTCALCGETDEKSWFCSVQEDPQR